MTKSNKEKGLLFVTVLVTGGLVLGGCSSTQQKNSEPSSLQSSSTSSSNLDKEKEAIKQKSMDLFWKGSKKYDQKDYKGAILDFNESIQIRSQITPEYDAVYMMRALSKKSSGDVQGAITDMQKATEIQKKKGDVSSYDKTMGTISEWKKL